MSASRFIDLRSDTATLPTPAMRQAIANAEVADDVFGEDPTVNRLQEKVAALLGHEAALFVPSGTMSNQIAIHLHTRPGDEVLCEANSHIACYEAGAPAALSGVTLQRIPGNRGLISVEDLQGKIQPDNPHFPRTRLLSLENTHNKGGGTVYPFEQFRDMTAWARDNGLSRHLDGARLWNAAVTTGTSLAEWGRLFDTVSVCFSKGLGAPVGSALVGPKEFIKDAVRVRKIFGGGMRQAGVIAAACEYALDHHIDRLAEDHANAKRLAHQLARCRGIRVDVDAVETNLIWFEIDPAVGSAAHWAQQLRDKGILVLAIGPQLLRVCTHLGVTTEDVDRVIEALRRLE